MPETKGLLMVCDRCGASEFRKLLGKESTDGGYTVWDKFEPGSEKWEFVHDIGILCPECIEQYEKLVEEFKNAFKPDETQTIDIPVCKYHYRDGVGFEGCLCIHRYSDECEYANNQNECPYHSAE